MEEIRQFLIEVFKKWGLPDKIKTDNGDPFGVPSRDVIPLMSLWLRGWGIIPILNRPKRPQDNAVVERTQGTSSRWAEVEKAADAQDLQIRLNLAIEEHRDKYPVKRLGLSTRTSVFPNLYTPKKRFDEKDFNINDVYSFLADKTLQRKVSSTGIVALYSKHLQVHLQFKGQYVFLKFDGLKLGWNVFNHKNEKIKFIPDNRFTKENIILLNLCQ